MRSGGSTEEVAKEALSKFGSYEGEMLNGNLSAVAADGTDDAAVEVEAKY